jgi:hypothetical protein
MRFPTILACATSMALVMSGPALAQGKKDRAREAVASAQAKVDAAAKVGAGGETPRLLARAQEMLRIAQEDLASDRKDKAIADANSASTFADQAIGEAERFKAERARADKAAADAATMDAQRTAADERARADRAAADANALRNAPPPPPVIITTPAPPPPPAPTSTTVTTETTAPAPAPVRVVKVAPKKVVTRRVVRKAPATPAKVKTTTTVTTNN